MSDKPKVWPWATFPEDASAWQHCCEQQELQSHVQCLSDRIEILTSLLKENIGMWLEHGSFYSVSDHEAWLKKSN